jgi:ankyrin repeat protein
MPASTTTHPVELENLLRGAISVRNTVKMLHLLEQLGADVNCRDIEGMTPLHHAVCNGHEEAVPYLLDRGANIDAKDNQLRTALHHAVLCCQVDTMKRLLTAGATLDTKDAHGDSPLHCASAIGNVDVLGCLLSHGTNVYDLCRAAVEKLSKLKQGTATTQLAHNGATGAPTDVLPSSEGESGGINCAAPLREAPQLSSDMAEECIFRAALLLFSKHGHSGVVRLLSQTKSSLEKKSSRHGMFWWQSRGYKRLPIAPQHLEPSPDGATRMKYGSHHTPASKQADDVFLGVQHCGEDEFGEGLQLEWLSPRSVAACEVFVDLEGNDSRFMLHQAVMLGNIELVDGILEAGADVEAKDSLGRTPMHQAIIHGNIGVVKRLLKAKADINACDDCRQTALHHAAMVGDLNITKCLIQAGADFQASDLNGNKPLQVAATYGNAEIIPYLMAAPYNDHRRDPGKALVLAVRNGHTLVVDALLCAGANLSDIPYHGFHISMGPDDPLVFAALELRVEMVERLLETGKYDHGYRKGGMNTALAWSIASHHPQITELLLQAGAEASDDGMVKALKYACIKQDVLAAESLLAAGVGYAEEEEEDEGHALACAVRQGSMFMVKRLLAAGPIYSYHLNPKHLALAAGEAIHGPDLQMLKTVLAAGSHIGTDANGLSFASVLGDALLSAAYANNLPAAKYLLDQGADVNYEDGECLFSENLYEWDLETEESEDAFDVLPLQLAALKGNADMVKLLLDYGAERTPEPHNNRTVLHCAARAGELTMLRQLLNELGFAQDLHARDSYGLTPLHHAVIGGNAEVIDCLLEAGADVELQDEGFGGEYYESYPGGTPLHYAIRKRNIKAAQLLLAAGASVAACNTDGNPCLYLAVEKYDVAMVKCLLEAGADANQLDEGEVTPLLLAADMWRTTRGEWGEEIDCSTLKARKKALMEIVECLVKAGADVNASVRYENENQKVTTLHLAARSKNHALVDLLLNAGARLDDPSTPAWFVEAPLAYMDADLSLESLKCVVSLMTAGTRAGWHSVPMPCPGLGRALRVIYTMYPPVRIAAVDGASVNAWVSNHLNYFVRSLPINEQEMLRTVLLCIHRRFPGLPEENIVQILHHMLPWEVHDSVMSSLRAGCRDWYAVPRGCPGLGRALLDVWESTPHEMHLLVSRLTAEDKEVMWTVLLCLRRTAPRAYKDLDFRVRMVQEAFCG